MHPRPIRTLAALSCALALPGAAAAQQLEATEVLSGLVEPVAVVSAPGAPLRLFVVERAGRIRVAESGSLQAQPFLDLSENVSTKGDGGLLSLAFHPDYAQNGRFFVGFSDAAEDALIREYRVSDDPNVADPGSGKNVFGPYLHGIEHYGLDLHFGPDGRLYSALGAHEYAIAQRPTSYSGKLLRLDVDEAYPHVPLDNPFLGEDDGVNDLIWASGLRNPWRFAFDRANGDLYVSDVGEWQREEIDYQPASVGAPGTSGYQGGRNYGWPCLEGTLVTGSDACDPTSSNTPLTAPVFELGPEANAIIGGRVYRGSRIPFLQGRYVCADFGKHRYWSFVVVNGLAVDVVEHTADLHPGPGAGVEYPSAFGEDEAGELYVVAYYDGKVFRIDPFCNEPQVFCPPAPNSTGDGAQLGWSGSYSIAASDLELEVSGCPPSVAGFFFHGPWEIQVPFGNGYRCINGTLIRLPLLTTSAQGTASQPFDAQAAALGPVETRLFQFFFRDHEGGGAQFNLSSALRVVFCP